MFSPSEVLELVMLCRQAAHNATDFSPMDGNAHGRSPSNDYFLASCKVSLYDRCMDLLVVEKSSQLIFISRFPQKFLWSPHPRCQCWYFEARKHIFFLPGGTFDRKKVRNQNPCCALPTLKSGGAGVSLVAEAYVSIVSMV